jgi:hypothetical protein
MKKVKKELLTNPPEDVFQDNFNPNTPGRTARSLKSVQNAKEIEARLV